MSLTPKQQLFVAEYLVDFNATAAYQRAGYKAHARSAAVNAARLLTNADIAAEIEQKQQKLLQKVELTAEKVLQEVARIARLARLQLSPEQLAQAQTELSDILGLIQELQAVDTSGIEPLAHPLAARTAVHLRLRDDVVTEVTSTERREALMANAPGKRDGLFLVPKVID